MNTELIHLPCPSCDGGERAEPRHCIADYEDGCEAHGSDPCVCAVCDDGTVTLSAGIEFECRECWAVVTGDELCVTCAKRGAVTCRTCCAVLESA